MLTQATAANMTRKSAYADQVVYRDGVPMFSWIDLSVTELCNRSAGSPKACAFCPRIDPAFYPNQRLHMSLALAQKIGSELRHLEYRGAVVLCGFGEPLLHPNLIDVVRALHGLRVEIVTNGDRLTPGVIGEMIHAGVGYFVVSMYDGPEQVGKFKAMFASAGYGDDRYVLRDRWYDDTLDFGLKLTNRAGAIRTGNQAPVDVSHPCFYPTYQLAIDWNGDVLLCVQDWFKRVRFGNVATQGLWEIWTSTAMGKRRRMLIEGRRCEAPCSGCNADGTMHGEQHAAAWRSAR